MSQLHLTLKPKASAVFADQHRFTMAVCGRRFGKSYLCVELIRDLRFCVYKPDTDTVDKTSDPAITHASDGLGYYVLGAMKTLMPDKYKTRRGPTMW